MTIEKKVELVIEHTFDPKTCRHMLNDIVSVLHCHHYSTLYTQLAMDCSLLDAKTLLMQSAEDSFYELLLNCLKKSSANTLFSQISVIEEVYSYIGLGKMKIVCAGRDAGIVELTSSHIDEGWKKKWGKSDKPVNYITCGYIAAAFSILFNEGIRTYDVKEVSSIVSGDSVSKFVVTKK